MWFAENLQYSRVELVAGQSVELLCNTSLTSDIMWTYDNDDDGYVHYVYWNGRIDSEMSRLSVKSTEYGIHSLVIADAMLEDSGTYDCFDAQGTKKIGYQLIINGKSSIL